MNTAGKFFSIFLILFGIGAMVYYLMQKVDALRIYRNDDHHFTMQYSKEATLIEDKNKIETSGYIPVCDPQTTLGCIVYPQETYPKSNFSEAGVSVGVIPAQDPRDCLAQKPGEQHLETLAPVVINGTTFSEYTFSEGAAGHQTHGFTWRTFYGDECIQLTARINTTTYENYEPGSIAQFTPAQQDELQKKLDAIIHTFRLQ